MTGQVFGIPTAARSDKRTIPWRLKTGEYRVTGENGKAFMKALDYMKVGHPDETARAGHKEEGGKQIDVFNMICHPAFEGRITELVIEIASNRIEDIWKDELSCYAGKLRFCGNDRGGDQALRLQQDGSYSPVLCDPQTCPFFRNSQRKPKGMQVHPAGIEIARDWAPHYEYAGLNKWSACKGKTWFMFRLPNPQNLEDYMPGMLCDFNTTSLNINNQIVEPLYDLAKATGGQMLGIRCKLKMTMTSNGTGGQVPTVSLVCPTGAELYKERLRAAKREGLLALDQGKVLAAAARLTAEEIEALTVEEIVEQLAVDNPSMLGAGTTMLALPAPIERRQIAWATEEPIARELIRRVRMSAPDVATLQSKYQDDLRAVVLTLIKYANVNGVDVQEVLDTYDWTTAKAAPARAAAPASANLSTNDTDKSTEVQEAQFTELPSDADDAALENAVTAGNMKPVELELPDTPEFETVADEEAPLQARMPWEAK